MTKQCKVNEKLGKNNTKNHEVKYNTIRSKIGNTKKCNGIGYEKGYLDVKGKKIPPILHGEEVHITQFSLCISSASGLQSYCKNCEKKKIKIGYK